ncbi:hypothetical protein D3C72_2222860 [compost metagenome]
MVDLSTHLRVLLHVRLKERCVERHLMEHLSDLMEHWMLHDFIFVAGGHVVRRTHAQVKRDIPCIDHFSQ